MGLTLQGFKPLPPARYFDPFKGETGKSKNCKNP